MTVVEMEAAEERLRSLIDQTFEETDGQFEIEQLVERIWPEVSADPELQALLLRRGLHTVMLIRLSGMRHRPRRRISASSKWDNVRKAVEDGSLDLLAMPVPVGNTGRWKPWGEWNFEDREEDRVFHKRIFGAAGVRLRELDLIDEYLRTRRKRFNRDLGPKRLLEVRERAQRHELEE